MTRPEGMGSGCLAFNLPACFDQFFSFGPGVLFVAKNVFTDREEQIRRLHHRFTGHSEQSWPLTSKALSWELTVEWIGSHEEPLLWAADAVVGATTWWLDGRPECFDVLTKRVRVICVDTP